MIGKVQYGSVTLDIVKINDLVRTPIYDDSGVDYICTEVVVDLFAVLNQAATSYFDLNGNEPMQGLAWPGRTDRVLFDYLSTPRRPLKMWAYDNDGRQVVYLESPIARSVHGTTSYMASDVRNGPKCNVFGINGADLHGAKTWILHIRFTTHINNCYDKTSPILSHRWDRSISSDDQHRAICTTRGTVIFNVARLWDHNFGPDDFRAQFFRPPAENMVRAKVDVQIAADNCTAHYTVIDAERFYNLGDNCKATSLEGNLTTWYSAGNAGAALAQTAPSLWSRGTSAISTLMVPGYGPVNSIRQVGGAIGDFAGNMQSNLPTYQASITVNAQGARNTKKSDLFTLCMAVAFTKLGHPSFFSLAKRTKITVGQALHDNKVTVTYDVYWMDNIFTQMAGIVGPIGSVIATLALVATNDSGKKWLASYFPLPSDDDPLGNNTIFVPNVPLGSAAENTARRELAEKLVGMGEKPGNGCVLLLSQEPIGNHPMNNHPDMSDARHNRGVGYMRILLAQGLMGQCPDIPALPNLWDKQGLVGGAPQRVTTLTVPLLPAANPAANPQTPREHGS